MMARRRILYVEMAHGMGGSLVSLYQLVRGLDHSRYEPVVLFYWSIPYIERFRELGVETIVWAGPRQKGDPSVPLAMPSAFDRLRRLLELVPWLSRFYHGVGFYARLVFQTLPLAWRIRQIIRSRGIDLIHANDLVSSNREVIIAAALTGRPCVCHIRMFERYTALDRHLVSFVDRFVYISQAIASSCIAQGVNPGKGVVVYNALDLDEFAREIAKWKGREELELSPADRVLGIVGRITPWKGHEILLRAVARAATSVPDLKCLVIGDAATSEQAFKAGLVALVEELGIAERVTFLGWRDDIPQLLSCLDVLVHASLEPEPFGRVLIEGMAAGKPVIATNAGACPEIVEDGVSGLLVPPGDVEALAQAITRLLTDPDLGRTMGIVGRHQVETRFSLAEHVRQIEQLYAQLLTAEAA